LEYNLPLGDKLRIPLQKEENKGSKQYPNLEPSPELAYILGVIDGDGSVSGYDYIQLGVKDYAFAKEFESALKAIGLRPKVRPNDRWNKGLKRQQSQWRCYASSTVFVNWYRSLTQEQKEGVAKQFPIEYLRGFFESEGSYNINPDGSAYVWFSSTNYELLIMVQRLLTAFGYKSRIHEYKHKTQLTDREVTCYRLSLLGSSEEKHEFIRKLNPCIKYRPYDYSDPNGLRGRNPKNRC